MIDHVAVVEEAVSWIYEHPDAHSSAEEIAAQSSYSVDHFGRLFKAVVGEPLGEFLLRQRLERAACLLLKFPRMSVTEIASDAGYSSSNFAVAFKKRYGKSPRSFRSDPLSAITDDYRSVMAHIQAIKDNGAALERLDKCCSVRTIPAMTLYRERFRGRYSDMRPAWHSFCLRTAVKFPNPEPVYIGISIDDPIVSDPSRSCYDMCVLVQEGKGPSFLHIPERIYAVNAFDDMISRFIYGYNELLAVWMPAHKLFIGDGPTLEIYRADVSPEGHAVCDICIPARV